ncbi:MAG: hypothetical protein AAGA83_26680 [Cyanobacteria bacterium P01_F01_bin.116]
MSSKFAQHAAKKKAWVTPSIDEAPVRLTASGPVSHETELAPLGGPGGGVTLDQVNEFARGYSAS